MALSYCDHCWLPWWVQHQCLDLRLRVVDRDVRGRRKDWGLGSEAARPWDRPDYLHSLEKQILAKREWWEEGIRTVE